MIRVFCVRVQSCMAGVGFLTWQLHALMWLCAAHMPSLSFVADGAARVRPHMPLWTWRVDMPLWTWRVDTPFYGGWTFPSMAGGHALPWRVDMPFHGGWTCPSMAGGHALLWRVGMPFYGSRVCPAPATI